MPPQKPRRDHPHFRQEEHDGGNLEHHDHAEQHLHIQIEGVLDARQERDVGRTEGAEERDHVGKDDVMAEGGARHRADGRQRDERDRELLLVGVERRRDQQPELIEDVRRGQHAARQQRDVDVERERLDWLGEDQVAAGWQHRAGGRQHERDDAVDERERGQHADEDGNPRTDEALPDLLELLEHRDPEASAVGVRRRQLKGRKPCHPIILTRARRDLLQKRARTPS